ncbi:response regulator [Brachybacterium hainanense]|uniref:Response regulator n=1 Tax=Brachybacterium hainanense TaxID=1541174 RepID=A0ABV6REA8_9MICO
MIALMIADDHPLMRQGIAQVLRAEPGIRVLAEVASGIEVLEHPQLAQVDVLLLDLSMPRLDGIGVLRVLADRSRAPRVLLLTAHSDERIAEAIEAGASGCIMKDAPPEELAEAVRVTARGGSVLSPAAADALVRAARTAALPTVLTQRERAVLRLVAQGQANSEIGRRLGISATTVKTHLQNAFAKLGARDRAHAVTIARDRELL